MLAQGARDFLLEHLQGFRRISPLRLAEEQVDVFGHDHITDQQEAVSPADLVKDLHEAVAGARRAEVGAPAIATKSHEVEIASSVKPPKRITHSRNATTPGNVNPRTLAKTQGCATHVYACYLQRVVRE